MFFHKTCFPSACFTVMKWKLIKIKVLSFQQDKHPTTLYGECRLRCFECLIIQLQEQFKDTKRLIRSRKSKDILYNDQNKQDKMTNNDLQNTTQKTEDRSIGTPLKTMGEHKCFGRVSSSWSTCGTRRAALLTNLVRSHERGKDGLWLRQTKHMRGYLWHRYFVTVKQVVATVKLSTWWLQLNK